jgi:hypothetical protein
MNLPASGLVYLDANSVSYSVKKHPFTRASRVNARPESPCCSAAPPYEDQRHLGPAAYGFAKAASTFIRCAFPLTGNPWYNPRG